MTSRATIPDPTSEQCTNNERIQLEDGRWATAAWYPQMGGYVSHCLIVLNPGEDCFEAYVWHDGSFPFGEDNDRWPGEAAPSPAHIHHCAADQFVGFGNLVNRLQGEEP